MLELRNISKSYGGNKVLDNFSLTFPNSGTVALLGPSGCGKTTLLRLIAGLEKPDSGDIIMTESYKISMVFQEDRLLEALDTRGNVLAVTTNRELADMCLARCGLLGAAEKRISELSGGMRRRVAIARAMAFGGNILLLDEPFKGLDDETKRMVSDFVFENGNQRLTLFITHDKDEIREDCKGIIEFVGPPLRI